MLEPWPEWRMVDPGRGGYGVRVMSETKCPWCSSSIPAGATSCPSCHAAVESATIPAIPGVTEIDPKARIPNEGLILSAGRDSIPAADHAFDPPSEEVLREMRKMELAAEIMNAGEAVMDAKDDESELAKEPSREAIEAAEAGLLDDTVSPAERSELHGKAIAWDEEEGEEGTEAPSGQ
jgi:hypothetical protein